MGFQSGDSGRHHRNPSGSRGRGWGRSRNRRFDWITGWSPARQCSPQQPSPWRFGWSRRWHPPRWTDWNRSGSSYRKSYRQWHTRLGDRRWQRGEKWRKGGKRGKKWRKGQERKRGEKRRKGQEGEKGKKVNRGIRSMLYI